MNLNLNLRIWIINVVKKMEIMRRTASTEILRSYNNRSKKNYNEHYKMKRKWRMRMMILCIYPISLCNFQKHHSLVVPTAVNITTLKALRLYLSP